MVSNMDNPYIFFNYTLSLVVFSHSLPLSCLKRDYLFRSCSVKNGFSISIFVHILSFEIRFPSSSPKFHLNCSTSDTYLDIYVFHKIEYNFLVLHFVVLFFVIMSSLSFPFQYVQLLNRVAYSSISFLFI